jgi:hypothetical protein
VTCFADNDVILKLAVFNLLAESLSALEVKNNSVQVLASAKSVLGRIARAHGVDVQHRISEFLASASITGSPSPQDLLVFEDTLGIDPGEAILFLNAAQLKTSVLTTGDKLSLMALNDSPQCRNVANGLDGRI